MVSKLFKTMSLPLLLLTLTQIVEAGREQSFLVDFDDPAIMRKIGSWEHNILDAEQSLKVEVVERQRSDGNKGKVMQLNFDVDSPNPAMVGCWAKLESMDLSGYDTLHLKVKSGNEERFSGNLALQFTDIENRKAPYLISGIGTEWKEFRVPLKKFRRIHDWYHITEFEIIIDDINARPKQGVLFVDQIFVSKGESSR